MSRHDQGSFDPSRCFQMPTSEGKSPLNREEPLKGAFIDPTSGRMKLPKGRRRPSWRAAKGELAVTPPN